MESDTLNNATTCGQLIHQLVENNTFFTLKVMKGKRTQDAYLLNTIIGQRTIPKDVTKVIQYTAKQGDKFISCRSPYYDKHDLLQYLNLHTNKRAEMLHSFIESIFRAEPLYLYSYQNLFFSIHTLQIIFNPTTTVGLVSIITKKNFAKAEFKETYQLLDRDIFEEEVQNRWEMITYKSKFRAIAMLILHIILGTRVSLLKETDVLQDQISFQDAMKLVHKIPERFRRFLKGKDVLARIKRAEEEDRANYLLFLRRVFQDNCAELEWKEVIMLLFIPFKQKTDQDLRKALQEISRRLFALSDEYSLKFLVQQGLAKKIGKNECETIVLIDQNLYLHYLLSAALFEFESVADQISQQKYMTQGNYSIFAQTTALISKLFTESDYQKQNLFRRVGFLQDIVLILRKSSKIQIEYDYASKKLSIDSELDYNVIVENPQDYDQVYSKIRDEKFDLQSQPTTGINHTSQPDEQTDLSLVVRLMAQKFKTHVAEVSGSKVLGLNSQMKMLNKFVSL